ncbi:histidinol-phosphate transaminase [bacterium]|nr:histidinol-phosphate transaminase [bacterium]
MDDIKNLIRKNIFEFQPYLPGRPIEQVKKEQKLKRVFKLASNENSLGPSPRAIKAIARGLGEIHRYPDGGGFYLKEVLAKKLKLKMENIILGNGTDEIIEIIGKTFLNPQDEIIVSAHAFIRYYMAGKLMACKVKTIPMKNFTHNLLQMQKAINKKTKVIFIANPNNPTGTYVNKTEVMNFMKSIPGRIIVVFDEAYYEYMTRKDFPDSLSYIKNNRKVIVLRTFSKIYGLAGLRIGYGMSIKGIIEYMERIRPPFNTNSLSQIAARVSFSDKEQIKKGRKVVTEGRGYIEQALNKMGVEYVPSVANFMLIKVGKGNNVFKQLLKKGIIARAMDEYGLPEYIRITIGLSRENKLFIKKLREVLHQCF